MKCGNWARNIYVSLILISLQDQKVEHDIEMDSHPHLLCTSQKKRDNKQTSKREYKIQEEE